MSYEKLSIGKNNYEYMKFGTAGKPSLFFLPGFSMQPHEHEDLFALLSPYVNGLSVKLIGVNYLENQPVTIDDIANSVSKICSKVFRDSNFFVAGHSSGATALLYATSREYIQPGGLALWSPVTARGMNSTGLLAAGIKLGMDEILRKGTFSFGIRHAGFLYDYFSHPKNSRALTREIAHFDYWMTENEIEVPARFVYAELDEFGFIPKEYDLKVLRSYFAKKSLVRMDVKKKIRHLWPRDNPEIAVEEIRKIIS